jgi:hypothetical protein
VSNNLANIGVDHGHSGVPTLDTVISDHRQMFGKSLATNMDGSFEPL